MNRSDQFPHPVRRIDVIVARMPDGEILLYDRRSHTAHALNSTAALVWNACDGHTAPSEIAHTLRESGHPIDDMAVWIALADLQRQNLVENIGGTTPLRGLSRKDMMKRIALAAAGAAVPTVTSIVAPTAADAATCIPSGDACSDSSQCCTKTCSTTTGVCA